jgi:ATP-dependent Lon protease
MDINSQQPTTTQSTPTISIADEIAVLEKKIISVPLPKELRDKSLSMINRLKKMSVGGSYGQEFEPVSEYINWITQLPFGKYTSDNLDIDNAQQSLNQYHFGLQPVKDRILEYLAMVQLIRMNSANAQKDLAATNTQDAADEMKRLQGSSSHAPILCFVGIQGVGKTSMAKSIANALGRSFIRIALGGLGNVSELRGRPRGTVDAEPGQIIKSLVRAGSMNPLILLDEIDKTSSESGLRADIMAALLEILDPEQNSTFMDKYLDYPIDLSQCLFITTANNLGGISAALLDRLEVIRFGSYTDEDKVNIAKTYLLPKVREATGLTKEQLDFADDVWPLIIRPMGFDAGVRQLERTLTELARKVAFMIVKGTTKGVVVTKDNFRQFIPEQIGILS